jgi:hypothetical protein
MKLQEYTIPTPTNRRATSDFNFEPPQKSTFLDQDPLTMADTSNKRQRLASYCTMNNIQCLPDDMLASVAKFLPKPSQALFAVAMTAPSLTRKKPWKAPKSAATNRAILSLNSMGVDDGEIWTTIDFVDIEKSLANRLTDDDIGAALVCIDAVNRLKKLKLTGCVNIKGTGLKPLRGSTVLEQIDLSFVKRTERAGAVNRSKPLPRLSVQCVEAVLTSIIDAKGSSLKHVVFPQKFLDPPNMSLDPLLSKYADFLSSKGGVCSNCNEAVWGKKARRDDLRWINQEKMDPLYGTQNYTCYDCNNHYCKDTWCMGRCDRCEKETCLDCNSGKCFLCRACTDVLCQQCGDFSECDACGVTICHQCKRNDTCYGCDMTSPFQRIMARINGI